MDCPLYVVHVMSRTAAEALEAARKRGANVWGEALAAALGTDGTHYKHECFSHAAGHVVSPPLRPDVNTPKVLMTKLAQWVIEPISRIVLVPTLTRYSCLTTPQVLSTIYGSPLHLFRILCFVLHFVLSFSCGFEIIITLCCFLKTKRFKKEVNHW